MRLGLVALLVGAAMALPAQAGDSNGNFQVKLGATGVWTDDDTKSFTALGGANLIPGGNYATTTDNAIPSLTLTYYLNNNLAVELFCCFDRVGVDAHGPAVGALGEVASTWIFPPILTLQYHFDGLGPIKPYVGVGAEWVHYFDSKSKIDGYSVDFDDSFGFALQAGVDYDLGQGWSLGVDVKKVWEDTKVTWTNTGTGTLGPNVIAKHDIDPLFVTANLGYRFNLSDLFGSRQVEPLK
ncbi:MAG: OmpW family outer membrane protein [Hyphomicrobium sp.]|jgi:outer membrane protein